MEPDLMEVGSTLEEARQLRREHDELLTKLNVSKVQTGSTIVRFALRQAVQQIRSKSKTNLTKRSQRSQECKDPRLQCFCNSRPWPFWPFDPKTNGFPGLIVEHFYVKIGDLSCINLRYRAVKQTHRQTPVNTRLPRLPLAWITRVRYLGLMPTLPRQWHFWTAHDIRLEPAKNRAMNTKPRW